MKHFMLVIGVLVILASTVLVQTPNQSSRLKAATAVPTTKATTGAATQAPVQATAKATAPADSCATAAAPRLKAGDRAKISKPSSKDFPGAYLKTDPTRKAPVLRYLPLDTLVDVVDGPRCGDNVYWWRVKYGEMTGWMAEASGKDYALDPSTDPASKPLLTTGLSVMACIKSADLPPETPAAPDAPATAAATAAASDKAKLVRLAFGTLDGNLSYTDNIGPSRVIATFNPPPLSVDLSPNGSVVLVVNYNGLYWVDVLTGSTVMIADATTLKLSENAWPSRVRWLPDGQSAAVEITDRQDNVTSYAVWKISLVDSAANFDAAVGALPAGSIKRSPTSDHVLLVSANDISLFPKNRNDDTPSILEFVARTGSEIDADKIVSPAIVWALNGKGFYAFIPPSAEVPGDVDPAAGLVWYIAFDGSDPKSIGRPRLKANEFAIPSPDGENALVGRGTVWTIQNIKSGRVLRTLPALNFLFGWTPDGKGVLYNDKANAAKYLGVDGGTASSYLPTVTDMYDIRWLADGTSFYVARGKDGKLSFSVKRKGEDAKFIGIVSSVDAFSVELLADNPPLAKAPEACPGK